MKHARLVLLVALTGCGVSERDAKDLAKGAEAVSTVEDSAQSIRLLMASCGEISSCAEGCDRALKFAAQTEGDPGAVGTVMGDCFPELLAQHKAHGVTVESWFVGYYRAYAKRAVAKLPRVEANEFQANLVKIALNAPKGDVLRGLADPL